MKNTLSFTIGKGVSLEYVADCLLHSRVIRLIRDEALQVERSYSDTSAVISAFSVYVFIQPLFMSFWPLLRTTYCLAHDILHLLFYFTAEVVNSIVCKAKSTARSPEYIHIQKEIPPVTPIIPIHEARARLLHRHQDRGCSDSAPNDNLLRRNLRFFPAALRVAQLL